MDDYPQQYVEHNAPVVALSGIGRTDHDEKSEASGSGTKIAINWPQLPDSLSANLRHAFQTSDGADLPWSVDRNPRRSGLHEYRCQLVGRSLSFPRRKAAPAPQAPSEDPATAGSGSVSINHDLHSPLSPLSPTSSLFPDGLMTPLWLEKHQRHIASVLLCFFAISTDPSTASLKDNELKNEIGSIKAALTRCGFRTKLAVVIVSDNEQDTAALEDRISIIRKASGLDAKSTFFHLPAWDAKIKLDEFALDVLAALQPVCIDYYRDLTKHARRKNNRGFIPPPTGASTKGSSASLTFQDWHARYEFKQGVFAEFRQEMDVAERHYIFAMDELFSPEGALENTPTWSPRWNEARELADITTLRILRCQLWRNMTSGAAETWFAYRDRTRDLVDRRALGTTTYGYAAWESRFAECMAQLIRRAAIPAFEVKSASRKANADGEVYSDASDDESWVAIEILAQPERGFPNAEKPMQPFKYLHHAGYWYRIAQKWAAERLRRVATIPDEDKEAPDTTRPGNKLERRLTQDTYMVPTPHEASQNEKQSNNDIVLRMEQLVSASAQEFALRRQYRSRSQVLIGQSQILLRLGKGATALELLRPVWDDMTWRTELWWDLAADVLAQLHDIAVQQQDQRLQVELRWEMMREVFDERFTDLLTVQPDPESGSVAPIIMSSQSRLSPVSATFSFSSADSHVGDAIPCQLVLASSSQHSSPVVTIEAVHIELNHGSWVVEVTHKHGNEQGLSQEIKGEDSAASGSTRKTSAFADLTLRPGAKRLLNLALHLREPGELSATSIKFHASFCGHKTQYSVIKDAASAVWYLDSGKELITRSLDRDITNVVNVLPKPPRLQVYLAETRVQYLTSDEISLDIVLLNEENDAVSGTVRLDMGQDILSAIDANWLDIDTPSDHENQLQRTVDTLGPGEQSQYRLSFKAPADAVHLPLSVSVDYAIKNDPDAPVQKTTTFNFRFVHPFDLDFGLEPRHDTESWPSFFHMPNPSPSEREQGEGIRQKWSLRTKLTSLALEDTHIESVALQLNKTSENVICNLDSDTAIASLLIATGSNHILNIPFSTQKRFLEDRRSSSLALSFNVTWRRASSDKLVTTTLKNPTLHIPPAEPRVLCTAGPLLSPSPGNDERSAAGASPPKQVVAGRLVRYTIENPSLHHLVFTVAMEASDVFAFSGPKSRAVTLPPLSRVDVTYGLIVINTSDAEVEEDVSSGAAGRGKWIYPVLRVQDAYFMKSLRVLVAGDGVRADDKRTEDGRAGAGAGVGVWVPFGEE